MNAVSPLQALQQQRSLLQLEYQTEKEAFRKQTETMGLGRKVKRGDAWFPINTGRTYYNSLNQFCIEVTRTADQDIEHNFEFGKPVVFWRSDTPTAPTAPTAKGAIHYFNFTGTVSFVDGDRMVVTIPEDTPSTCKDVTSPSAYSSSSTRQATGACSKHSTV